MVVISSVLTDLSKQDGGTARLKNIGTMTIVAVRLKRSHRQRETEIQPFVDRLRDCD
jgi:hypothetical protein